MCPFRKPRERQKKPYWTLPEEHKKYETRFFENINFPTQTYAVKVARDPVSRNNAWRKCFFQIQAKESKSAIWIDFINNVKINKLRSLSSGMISIKSFRYIFNFAFIEAKFKINTDGQYFFQPRVNNCNPRDRDILDTLPY